jgi:hypothetical protein
MDDQRTDSPLNFNGLFREKVIIVLFFDFFFGFMPPVRSWTTLAVAFLIRMTVKVKVFN